MIEIYKQKEPVIDMKELVPLQKSITANCIQREVLILLDGRTIAVYYSLDQGFKFYVHKDPSGNVFKICSYAKENSILDV